MTVVSDSSPLITLAKTRRLELLPQLYQTIAITPQVYDEVVVNGKRAHRIGRDRWVEMD